MNFLPEFFQKIEFQNEQIDQYFQSAKKDFLTAQESNNVDVVLHFGYSAILKLGIGLIAKEGFKVRSIPGHHIKILDAMTTLTGLEDELNYIQRIRRKRNVDLYEGGISLSQKEAAELLNVVGEVFQFILKNEN